MAVNVKKLRGKIFDIILKQDGMDEGVIGVRREELANRIAGWLDNYNAVVVVPESSEVGRVVKYYLAGGRA